MTQAPSVQAEIIYDRYRAPLYQYLCKLTRNPHDAQDMVQETFLRWIQFAKETNLPAGLRPQSAKAWLYRTSYRIFVDDYRKNRKRVHVPLQSLPELASEHQVLPESAAMEAELISEIRKAVSKLPERDQSIMLLLALGDLSYREIARRVGCAESSVKNAIHRSRKRMRQTAVYGGRF